MENNDAIQHEVRTGSRPGRGPRAEVLKILDEFEVVSASVNDARDIGEHTASFLTGALDLNPAELEGLAERGVIGPARTGFP
jgi:hypothetical protein